MFQHWTRCLSIRRTKFKQFCTVKITDPRLWFLIQSWNNDTCPSVSAPHCFLNTLNNFVLFILNTRRNTALLMKFCRRPTNYLIKLIPIMINTKLPSLIFRLPSSTSWLSKMQYLCVESKKTLMLCKFSISIVSKVHWDSTARNMIIHCMAINWIWGLEQSSLITLE